MKLQEDNFELCSCGLYNQDECDIYCVKDEIEEEQKIFKLKQSKKIINGDRNGLRDVSSNADKGSRRR